MLNEKELKRFLIKKYYGELSKKNNLTSATVEILNFCNFKCVHCYNQNLRAHYMKKDLAFRIIDQLVALGCQNITLTGGEPTLNPDFAQIYQHCFEQGLKVSLFTNGFYLDKFLPLLTQYPPEKIEISIYGSNDHVYANICKVEDGFSVVMKNIRLLLAHGLPVYAKSVILQQNFADYDNICRAVQALGLPYRVDMKVLTSKDFNNDQSLNRISDEQFTAMMDRLKETKSDSWTECVVRKESASPYLYTCGAGRISLFVSCTGGVRMCNFAEFSERQFEDNLDEIWRSFESYTKLPKASNTQCADCQYRAFCSNCPVVTYMEHHTDGKCILPIHQNCREAQYIYESLKNDKKI